MCGEKVDKIAYNHEREQTSSKTWPQLIVPYKLVLGMTTKKMNYLRKLFYL